MKSYKNFLTEAGGISEWADLWKRKNRESFIKKAIAGELVDTDGNFYPKIKSSHFVIKIAKAYDTPPEKGSELEDRFSKAFKDAFKLSRAKMAKAANGFSPASSGEPSGEDWESLIAVGLNKIQKQKWNVGAEWERAEKFWGDYEDASLRLANDFVKKFKIKKLVQLGSGTRQTHKNWRSKNKTPKTDLLSGSGKQKISLKKYGGSQLMSGKKEEAISTFEAAMTMYSISSDGKKAVESVIKKLQKDMGEMSTAGTIGSIEKMRDSGKKLSAKDKAKIAEMEGLQDMSKVISKKMETLFTDMKFKSYFCWEAATGTYKFQPSPDAVANFLVVFKDTGSISSSLVLDKPLGAGKTIAGQNDFYVSFKTGSASSRPYLSLRTKKTKNVKKLVSEGSITLKDIILEECSREELGEQLLNESSIEQLNEFQLFDKIKQKFKDVSQKVVDQAKKIYAMIMSRINEVFNYILILGEKILSGLLKFLGLEVSDVKISGGGDFNLEDLTFGV
jgi:hypothetical protein